MRKPYATTLKLYGTATVKDTASYVMHDNQTYPFTVTFDADGVGCGGGGGGGIIISDNGGQIGGLGGAGSPGILLVEW
jgi:hypothetical protein